MPIRNLQLHYILSTFLLFIFNSYLAAQTVSQDTVKARRLVTEAEALFNKATAETDSQALLKCQQAVVVYEKYRLNILPLSKAYVLAGALYMTKQQPQRAMGEYRKLLATARYIPLPDPAVMFMGYKGMGDVFMSLNQHDSAFAYYSVAEGIAEKAPPLEDVAHFYNSLGFIYYSKGNYKQAINYFSKAIDFHKQNYAKNLPLITLTNINISDVLRKMGRHDESMTRYNEALKDALKLYGEKHQITAIIYQNLGRNHLDKKDAAGALISLDKAQHIYRQLGAANIDFEINLYNNFGAAHLELDQLVEAASFYDKAATLAKKNISYKNVMLVRSCLGKGQVHTKLKNFNQALVQYQEAISHLHFSFKQTDIYRNPQDLNNSVSQLYLFDVLKHKAGTLHAYYQQSGNLKDLQTALATYQLALDLAGQIRKSYDSDEMKLFFTDRAYPVYEQAISVAFALYEVTRQEHYKEVIFSLVEKSKAAVLAETLRNAEIKQYSGIPPQLLKEEKTLKEKIAHLNSQVISAKAGTQIIALREQIREFEIKLNQVIRQFEKYPRYYQLKYDTSTIRLANVQESVIDHKTAILEFFSGKENVYAMLITAAGIEVRKFANDKQLQDNIVTLKNSLYTYEEYSDYKGAEAASAVYRALVQPFRPYLDGRERLITIPDAYLNYLPFDALISDLSSERYLLYDYTISRAYSTTLLYRTLMQKSAAVHNSVMAIAPFAVEESISYRSFPALPNSRKEVASLTDIYPQLVALYRESANKEAFLKLYPKFDILHLATHAQADDRDPGNSFILFYPQDDAPDENFKLYTHELYNLQLHDTRLIVLSACETGNGKLVSGEGIVSLARAFAYAGCQNIITTLWKANDEASGYISTRLHHYLREGKPKDEALKQAKIDYLNTLSGHKEPYYWANFVFIGNYEPLYETNNYMTLGSVAGAGMVALVAFWMVRRKKKQ